MYFYLNYDFTKKPIEYSNLSISAELNNQKVVTGYIIETIDGEIIGNTSQSYEKVIVRKNQIIKIYNKNINDQNFYTDLREVNITKDTMRFDLKLEEPKEIRIKIISEEPLIIDLKSEDARDIDFCLTWSLNYIFVDAKNFTEIEKQEGWEKCYNGDFSLKNSNQTIQIDYSKFGIINDNDYIKLLLINSNKQNTKIVEIL